MRKIGEKLLDDDISAKAHAAINSLLQLIATADSPVGVVSQNHEGGSVWLFREVYEATYDALTENIHTSDWHSEKKPSSSGAIMDGILSITWHLFIARAYYVDVFLPTHDIQAFWEYLYHRVSAIRIITLLISIIEKGKKEIIWENLTAYCEELSSYCGTFPLGNSEKFNANTDNPFEWYVWVLGVFDPIKRDTKTIIDARISDAPELMKNLGLLRKNALDTLLMALNKNKLLFRIEAAPDSVLAWSNQFLDFELDNMAGVINGNKEDCPEEIKETFNNLYKLFEKLKYQALLSKMDYQKILDSHHYDSESDFQKEKENFTEAVSKLTASEKGEVNLAKDIKLEVTKQKLNDLLNIARCLVHPYDHRAKVHTDFILNELDNIIKKEIKNVEIEGWVKRKRLIALELRGRSRFADWIFWQPLLERKNSDLRIADDKQENLANAEIDSILFEDLLRETTKTNDEDAKNRSNALTIRARALYLRGHFPQAHHFLDLASTGLFPERMDHWSLISIVHIARAELLAISAYEHYFSLSKRDQVLKKLGLNGTGTKWQNLETKDLPEFAELVKILQPIAASSLKKIARAEQELHNAEKLLRRMAYQNIWLIRMEFGWAQVRVERLLFEMEILFLLRQPLSVNQYLKKSGELEQTILDTMQRLRNVLDTIPYQSCQWNKNTGKEDMEKAIGAGRSMFQIECNVYKLWRQLFVVGAYYSSLLNSLYTVTGSSHLQKENTTTVLNEVPERFIIPCLTGLAITGDNAMKYSKQWQLWCTAMRFDNFKHKDNMDTFNLVDSETVEILKSVSFRATVINVMLKECGDEKIKAMWNIRRGESKGSCQNGQ